MQQTALGIFAQNPQYSHCVCGFNTLFGIIISFLSNNRTEIVRNARFTSFLCSIYAAVGGGMEIIMSKKIKWYALAFMAFSTVWGFGNVINGYYYFNGLHAIIPWVFILAVYFVPYALIVGELGSAFKTLGGGVGSWVEETMGKKMAFYAGWTYWVVHMPYISQKPTSTLIGLGWAFFRDGRIGEWSVWKLQLSALVLFAAAVLLSLMGIKFLKKISSIAGTAIFIMSILFILMMIAAPAVTKGRVSFSDIDWSWNSFRPELNANTFMNVAILVFAVGGCEKLSPYVNKMENPAKDFPLGMIWLAGMVAVCAILGTIAMGMMFAGQNIEKSFVANGAYESFRTVGQYFGVGDTLMVIYAICNAIAQVAVIILSIDAPLRILLESADEEYIPRWLTVRNRNGVYQHGVLIVAIVSGLLILIPAIGIGDVHDIVKYILDLNAVCMPLRYLWVFAAYFAMKKHQEQYEAEYRFVKSKKIGMFFGAWCFLLTLYACLIKIFNVDGDSFKLILNLLTPFILVGMGLILPYIARRSNQK